MGIVDTDHFDLIATNIPFFPVNYDLMNICYLIIHTPPDVKKSHMSIIIDLGGNSTQTHIIGLMVHLIANLDDGLCPHSTTIKQDISQMDRSSVDVIVLGKLEQSKYLNNNNNLPAYFLNHVVSIATYSLFYLKKRHIYIHIRFL
jgi:hypothetical protein